MSGEQVIMTWLEGAYKNLLRVTEFLADVGIGYSRLLIFTNTRNNLNAEVSRDIFLVSKLVCKVP